MEKVTIITERRDAYILSEDEVTKIRYALFRVGKTIAWENEVVKELPAIVIQRNKAALDEISQLMKMLE